MTVSFHDLTRELTPDQMRWLLIELAGLVSEEVFECAVQFAIKSAPVEVAS